MATEESTFPKFVDGDVLIILSSSRTYYLHSGVLRRNSITFAKLLDESHAAVLSSKAKKEGVTTRFRLDLTGVSGNVPGRFVKREVDSNGRTPGNVGLFDIENGKVVPEVYKHYDNLFRAFYNEKPDLDDTNIATVLNDCVGLIDVAESLGSIGIISESVDIALLRQGQVLFRSIAANAIAWADLAYRVRSPTIFKEALIHLIGQWNQLSQADRDTLNPEVLKICQRKHDDLNIVKQAIEIRILGHYPGVVQRQAVANPGRMSYSNDIYMWMVLSLFRHWFSQSICEQRNFLCKDGGATLYRQIGEGGYSYLDRKTLEGFHVYFPMSGKGMSVLENHLSVYKQELKPFVSALLKHHSQLDITKEPVPYLTCCVVEKSDYPWKKDRVESTSARDGGSVRKRHYDDADLDDNDEEMLANMSKIVTYGDDGMARA